MPLMCPVYFRSQAGLINWGAPLIDRLYSRVRWAPLDHPVETRSRVLITECRGFFLATSQAAWRPTGK
jgi:hypothetical protein